MRARPWELGSIEKRSDGSVQVDSIAKQGSNSTIVWNPWVEEARAMKDFGDGEWREMICIESANAGKSVVLAASPDLAG